MPSRRRDTPRGGCANAHSGKHGFSLKVAISRDRVSSLLPPLLNMPPQRTPLGPINGNEPCTGPLSEFERGRIIGMSDRGAKKAIISRYYNHPYSTVTNIIEKQSLRDDGHSLPRTGLPKCYSDVEERLVLRHVRKFPKHTYAEVIKACGVTF